MDPLQPRVDEWHQDCYHQRRSEGGQDPDVYKPYSSHRVHTSYAAVDWRWAAGAGPLEARFSDGCHACSAAALNSRSMVVKLAMS